MIYREISIYRVMRFIAKGETKNLYFQHPRTLTLSRITSDNWGINEFQKYKFFELENKEME